MTSPTDVAAQPGHDPDTGKPLHWTDLDKRAVDTVRVLAMDAVESAGNGHPGTAMSLAPAAYLLFQRLLRHDPSDPSWLGRDRFVLSCGHSSLTLYIQLYLSGYGLSLDDLRRYRQWGSLTPGHPEHGHTLGVETTTGPLGQGLSNAVGMAMAARRVRGMFDPDAAPGESAFDHTVWVFASDGDIQEGVASEAGALAGHQRLGNLVVLYDDNHISIDGDTDVAQSEDVLTRFEAYGWHTQRVDWIGARGSYKEDVKALHKALATARDTADRPSIVALRSIIAWPAPDAQNTGAAHGAALGKDEVAATKKLLGFHPDESFDVADDVLAHAREVITRGQATRAGWEDRFDAWRQANQKAAAELDRMLARRLPTGWEATLPAFDPGSADKPAKMATRKASGQVINAIAAAVPELWGGSADLTGSNLTDIKGEPVFLPDTWGVENSSPHGRNIHFGIREHAMGSALNGMALNGITRPYGGTFLVFSDYMRGAVRLAALMKLPVTYVWTHDSIGLGEDGPTHQPIEHLWALRAIPGLAVVRPADATETVEAWRTVLERQSDGHGPAGLCLTRQDVPTLDRSHGSDFSSAAGVSRGGYVLADASAGMPQVILIGSGSEVHLALAAREQLEAEGVPTRVVSMPCVEWFEAQDDAYQQQVLPPAVQARVAVEAGIAQGWWKYVGGYGEVISLEDFGASAPYETVYEQLGMTADRVTAAAHASLAKARGEKGSTTGT